MEASKTNLINSLFSIINKNKEQEASYVLAKYFLDHYHVLSSLNIYEVAEECFVSRASVRRFCQSLGLSNFLDLKAHFADYHYDYDYYMGNVDRVDYRENLTKEINEMIEELDRRMNTQEIEVIVQRMYKSPQVFFLCSDNSLSPIIDFQQSMILNKKLIRIVTDPIKDGEVLSSLKEEDYIITISPTGNFALATLEALANIKAYRILTTVNREQDFSGVYQKVYHLSAKDRASMGKSVYSKYGISYMLDVLFSAYSRRYGL